MRLILFLLVLSSKLCSAQDSLIHLQTINTIKEYYASISGNEEKVMKDIKEIPGIILDLRYSTKENFMHKKLYPAINTTYLRARVIKALMTIEKELMQEGFVLKIWDAYRPYSVTRQMWTEVHDERYVANPKNGSGHNKGIAVDVTLCDKVTGIELEMGTGFDNFTDSAHADYTLLSSKALSNRKMLKTIMEKAGFKNLATEWWHYSMADIDHDEVLNLSFKDLKKITRKKLPIL